MIQKILLAGIALLVVVFAALFLWARSVLTSDTVRSAVAQQFSKALGQPVQISGISATIFPRVTMKLDEVKIGEPARITVADLRVGTDFRALLSRRIEHGSLRLNGARVELPLPPLALGQSEPRQEETKAGSGTVQIVSIDEMVLQNVELVSGGRTLRGDIELVPTPTGVTLRKAVLGAGDAAVTMTGEITDLAGPTGELTLKAGKLNLLELVGFAADFANGLGTPGNATAAAAPTTAAAASSMNISLTLDADRAVLGTLALDRVSGRARITARAVTLEPIRFEVFGGRYDGTLALSLSETPDFTLGASLSDVDMAEATRFAGSPDSLTGRLAGRIDLRGRGTTADSVLRSVHGQARVDIKNGTIKGMGLVRTIVLAGSGRADAKANLAKETSTDSFTQLAATLAIANGTATTRDLGFDSKDVLLSGSGSFRLDGTAINLVSRIQLSDELSKQAGQDLVRYTQEQGRVTLPATVTGSVGNFQVRVDMADAARRAITNRANEEAKKAINKGLGGLLHGR